jgi:isoquinoline 1-oxidoreductase subunit beta
MNKPLRLGFDIEISRRSFLVSSLASGAVFGFERAAGAASLLPGAPVQSSVDEPAFEPTIWFSVDRNGLTWINIPKAEMGQHIGTALARILADELEADWDSVRLVGVDTDPKWGPLVTGASTSVWSTYPTFSRAGAAGRVTLIQEGAKLLGVSPEACIARKGRIEADGRSISYGEIVQRGDLTRRLSADDLKALTIKTRDKWTLVGRPVRALDVPPKTTGKAVYGIDAVLEGMVCARPKMPPTRYGSKVISIDDSAAKQVKGYLQSVALEDLSDTVPGWVMVIAETYPAAIRATELLQVIWQNDETASVSDKDLHERAQKLIADKTAGAILDTGGGDIEAAFAQATTTLEATYTTAGVLHFQLEPVNALAFQKDGVFEIHTGNQAQSFILPVLAKALQVAPEKIVMRTYLIGGGFGRRLNGDYCVPAALTAKALQRPVKMVLTRADDSLLDSIRSPTVQTLRLGFDAQLKPVAMDHAAAAGWPVLTMAPKNLVKGANGVLYDPFSIAGADHWYDVGVHRVRAINNDLAQKSFRPGWLRAVSPGWTNWALESFMDEAAHKIGQDPLAFRLANLTGRGINAGSAPNAVGGRTDKQTCSAASLIAPAGDVPCRQIRDWVLPPPLVRSAACPLGAPALPRLPSIGTLVSLRCGSCGLNSMPASSSILTARGPRRKAPCSGASAWRSTRERISPAAGFVTRTSIPIRHYGSVMYPSSISPSSRAQRLLLGWANRPRRVIAPAIGNAIFAAIGLRLRHLPIRSLDVLDAQAKASAATITP